MSVRHAERALRGTRFVGDDGDHIDKDVPPKAVLAAAHNLENAVHEFATTAQKLTVWPHNPPGDEAWLDHVERARVLAAAR